MQNALTDFAGKVNVTPQREQIPGRTEQVRNSAGGYVFAVDDWTRLHRFLILGTEGGTYYVGQNALTKDNATALYRLIDAEGERVVDAIVKVSEAGDAPKQDPTLFALAVCSSAKDPAVRKAALDALPRVCRTGTMLFHFVAYAEKMRGWGPAMRKAVARWYERDEQKIAYQAVKYRQRDGWSHRDLIRLSHPSAVTDTQRVLFDWIAGRKQESLAGLRLVQAYERINEPDVTVRQAVSILHDVSLPWEALPDRFINEPDVWDVLLDTVGVGALLRQLPRLTRIGLLKPLKPLDARLNRLTDVDALRSARVHPVSVLNALFGYRSGSGASGTTWTPVPKLVDVLDDAFHASFGAIEPSGKRHLLAIDVSGSMRWEQLKYLPALQPADAAAAMAMATVRVEQESLVTAFSHTGLDVLPITARNGLHEVINALNNYPAGGTDCSLPMLGAMEHDVDVDTFVVYTDNETWAGRMHPTQALAEYRQKRGLPSRLAVCGMTSTGFSIADPTDAGQLDLVGFDAAAPQILSEFSAEAL